MRGKLTRSRASATGIGSFNEARALCAGNWDLVSMSRVLPSAFNEARALCAGNWDLVSMSRVLPSAFNEARALCAGNSVEGRGMH